MNHFSGIQLEMLTRQLERLHRDYGISVIVSVCIMCRGYLGNKDGMGITGISHGYCPECLEKLKKDAVLKG